MARISVIITTRNERKAIRHLLDSLLPQRHVHEVILVDALSTDGTLELARSYEATLPLTIISKACTRGEGRNIGAEAATGDLLCFTDGDCIANARWTEALAEAWNDSPKHVVAGRTIMIGYWAFTKLHRVELPHRGSDTTWPSCNLAYPRTLFHELGGFDAAFITAEDIDLNFRAIEAGASIVSSRDAIIYARARDSIGGFLKQAYWNGFGRKQLTQKHGRLWHQYSLPAMLRLQGGSLWGILRMGAGFLGYVAAKAGRSP